MDYERLKTFIAVAEKKNFSEAAKILYVTQPTISAQIKALEEELGTKLFERTTKKVEMTQSAEILLKYAKKIIHLSDSAHKEILKFEDSMYGDLKIGCSFTIGEYVLPEFLKLFKDEYPLIQMSVNITNSNNIVLSIKDQIIDVGLIETPIEDAQIVVEPFMEDELILIAAPGYFSDNEITISAERLKVTPLIVREKGSGTRAVVNQYLNQAGITEEDLNLVMELGSTEAVKSAVCAKLGVSIISKSAIKKELKLKLLKAYPIKDISFYREFYIACRKDTVLKQTSELFMDQLKSSTVKSEKGVS
ncbi:MAG TPA: LysR family transcriptional regulator [Bacillus bacterium]|uniref:LysR family transcriptional regulator n=1 Tax=Siminovitchia fordii TaxID=254759 RepID=A0ABQ4K213_9BACI|nr:selenium metabolism-associated LysR family transcriptional regulator [Siminovitchia fordii]GIN19157.1 LysR family transcriptional regulator [Siminovitchia fordii]HBZ10235.1 LysR family transcriptional regulator [Bacillus sp. (in: firmicutes)]